MAFRTLKRESPLGLVSLTLGALTAAGMATTPLSGKLPAAQGSLCVFVLFLLALTGFFFGAGALIIKEPRKPMALAGVLLSLVAVIEIVGSLVAVNRL